METLKFVLYLADDLPASRRAAHVVDRQLRQVCTGRYELEVVDVSSDPARAESARIVATPTLVRISPAPERRVVGDLSDWNRVIAALEID